VFKPRPLPRPSAHEVNKDTADAALSDEDLMQRYASGDKQAFVTLFSRYTGRIFGFLFHSTGDRALAEDLAQQTWLRLHHGRATYRPGARFAPWIYTIAANLRRDHARSTGAERLTEDGLLPEPQANGSAQLSSETDRAVAIQKALQSLPEGHREVIVLHCWHDLGFAEIAEILGTSEGAVKVRAHRSYLQLRELLTQTGAP
jgi:RNA polymerase sigma-70 factor (ECF subfamily)